MMPNRFDNKNKPTGNNRLTRRQFVATAGAAVVAPAIVPSSVLGSNAPSNRINVAMRLKRKLQWDPEQEMFVNDDQANQMLRRPYREPWQI